MKKILLILAIFLAGCSVKLGTNTMANQNTNENLGAFGDPFLSVQLASSPSNGKILKTDGTDNSWITCTDLTGSAELCDGTDSIGSGAPFAWTPDTTYGTAVNATSTPLWIKANLYTSSTANYFDGTTNLVNASITGNLTNYYSAACAAGEYLNDIADDGTFSCVDATTEINTAISTHTGIANAHHNAVTLAGEDYLTLATQQITANAIDADNLSATDFGDFTCNGTTCSLDGDVVASSEIDTTATYDWTGLHTYSVGLISNASSTIKDLTVAGNATTTGDLILSSTASVTDWFGSGRLLFYDEDGSNSDFVQTVAGTGFGSYIMAKSDGTLSTPLLSDATDSLGGLYFYGYDGDTYTPSAEIIGSHDNVTTGNNDMPGFLDFRTTADAGTTATSRLTIDSAGQVSVATSGALQCPYGTAPVVDEVGEIAFDTTDNQFLIATSTEATSPRVIPRYERLWSATVASTSIDFINGGSIMMPANRDAVYIKEIYCGVENGTSVVINVSSVSGTKDTETVTCDLDGASDTNITNNYSVGAGATTTLEIGAITGTPDYLSFSVWGSVVRE